MRITFNMLAMRYDNSLSSTLTALTEATDRVNAKRNLLTPEQNPGSLVSAYNLQRMIDELTQFGSNATSANGWVKNSADQLEAAMKIIAKAKNDLAVGGSNASNDAASRLALATEALAAFNSLMQIGNNSYLGRYIFGGFQTDKPPFTQNGNQVTSIISQTQNGGTIATKPIFSDIPELASGKYVATVTVENGVAKLTMQDQYGKTIMLDTNGSDQSGKAGNNTSSELVFEFKPGEIINTGRGVSVQMPDTATGSVKLQFDYTSGSEVAYAGDLNSILAQIGYNQNVALNMPGSSIFTQSFKTLLTSKLNTVNGLPAGLSSLFSQLDKTSISSGDAIKVSGTDHSGKPLGSANILAPTNAKLDQTKSTEAERTLHITYGDQVYKIVIPQASYKTSEALSTAINNQLQFAEYVGTVNTPATGYNNINHYRDQVQSQISSGYFNPANNPTDAGKYAVDLRGQVTISADGDRLQFTTTTTGDNVRLAVSGDSLNSLGFTGKTLASEGKDTSFDFGTDFSTDRIQNISTTHTGLDFAAGGNFLFVVNGKQIRVNIPPAVAGTPTVMNNQNLSGTTDYTFTLKGKNITVKAADLAAAGTDPERVALINKAITDSGFGGQYVMDPNIVGAINNATITFNEQTSPLQKDIELAFDKALQGAGMGFTVGASLKPVVPAQLGSYNLSFSSVNNNIDKTTEISSTYINNAVVPPVYDLQTNKPTSTSIDSTQRSFNDYVNFLQNLYGDTAKVSLVNGMIEVKDNRSGVSKLTFFEQPTNTGIGTINDQYASVGGKYQGTYNDNWNVTYTTTIDPNGNRNVAIRVLDQRNNTVFDKTINNYVGGPIELGNGVNITPGDMNLPEAGVTSRTSQFQLPLTASTNLSLGDAKITDDGASVNIFRALTNLEHALRYNITKYGFSEPTAWKNNSVAGAAKPFLDGTYKGSYNDNWNYEVLQNNKSDFYLQNEYRSSTGVVKYNPALVTTANSTIRFDVDIYDNTTGKNKTLPISIDMLKAFPPITDAKSAQDFIIKQLNANGDLVKEGITFSNNSGKIEMSSNNGTKIASLSEVRQAGAAGATSELTSYILGLPTLQNNKITFPVTIGAGAQIQVMDLFENTPGIDMIKDINITANTYNTSADLLADINAQLATAGNNGTNGRVTASFDTNGALQFKLADGSLVNTYSTTPAFGLANDIQPSKVGPTALQTSKTDLSDADDSMRSLKFSYRDATGAQQSTSITLDKKAYASQQEVATEINSKLAAAGIINNQVTAGVDSNGKITFRTVNAAVPPALPIVNALSVEGDYAGTLGFPKAGDEVKIRVSSENGGTIQEVTMNVANKTTYIADSLYLGFDKGSMKVADSFSAAIGSGIENEITSLDKAEKQILRATSIFGNRGSRIDTVLAFQKTVIKSSETTKAGYLGATEADVVKAATDALLAQKAYESAMSITGRMMSLSLLDFLR